MLIVGGSHRLGGCRLVCDLCHGENGRLSLSMAALQLYNGSDEWLLFVCLVGVVRVREQLLLTASSVVGSEHYW